MIQTMQFNHVDARDEAMRVGSITTARPGPEPEVPSPNLAKVIAALKDGELAVLKALAQRIEAGEAACDDAESLKVYEGLPLLLEYVEDLVQMCQTREQGLAECHVIIGHPT
jgi:hypothetical protein